MATKNSTPKGAIARSLAGGKTAAQMGTEYLRYKAGEKFLPAGKRGGAKKKMLGKSARALFDGLCNLKGTALKMAQLLSLELDIFPLEFRAELERSYNEAPSLNRAMVRKVVMNAYGKGPEEVFKSFDGKAFAAASLGQVHRAVSNEDQGLVLKIQYPGIKETIKSDVRLMKTLARPFPEYKIIAPAIEEVEKRFLEETDYQQEAENILYFRKNLEMDGVEIPEVHLGLCTDKVLCMSHLKGQPLNQWIKANTDQEKRDQLAQQLEDLFIKSLYEMNTIHADPNPGNFIVMEDGSLGLVDFGCVKRFDKKFVALFRRLPLAFNKNDSAACLDTLSELGTLPKNAAPELMEQMKNNFHKYGAWLKRLFEPEVFDFGQERDFITQGKEISTGLMKTWRQLNINPDFVFLDRTRYGLLRLFELMEARVCFRSKYEWPDPDIS